MASVVLFITSDSFIADVVVFIVNEIVINTFAVVTVLCYCIVVDFFSPVSLISISWNLLFIV